MPRATVVNVRNNDCTVYIGRGRGGDGHMLNTEVGERGWLGNPFKLSDGYSREESIERFEEAFREKLATDREFRDAVIALDGTLGCWCAPKACHGEVIADFLNSFH